MNTDLKSILSEMTLDEKIAQLMQLAGHFYEGLNGEITGPMEELGINDAVVCNSGSVLGASGASQVIKVQQDYLKKNRLGIPLLFMADIVHGFKTIFPVPLAIGCSWNTELAEKSAEIAAREAAVSGVHVTFAPMVDLVRDPRWGRVMESTGEDAYLNSEFARAFVRGFQGHNMKEETFRVAACVKHFAAYGAPEAGRDYNTVNMSERQLRESYLPSYKAALEEGCAMVMTAFNTIDGIPASGNSWLMRDVLRKEWGFNGVLISDWGAVKELIPHGVAEDEKEAANKAIHAGVDIEMMTICYVNHLKELVEEGTVQESLINESVLRILELKEQLGLFENPYRAADPALEAEIILSEEHREVARQLAEQSCVLLKNNGVLPLSKDKKLAVIGPFAQSGDILGPWSWKGNKENAVQVFDAIQKKIGVDQVLAAKGCEVTESSPSLLSDAMKAAEQADILIVAAGESSQMSGEAKCRADIRLPEAQLQLIKELKTLNKPMVIVLFNGRPLDLHGVLDQADAVLEAWFPGTEGGHAISNLLFGEVNPSGKLTMSFPHSVGQVPVYYNHFNTGRPMNNSDEEYLSKYLDIPNEPMLPFGYGLSYSHFEYSDLQLSAIELTEQTTIEVTVKVKNTGKRRGEEIVQLYIRDVSGEVVRPMKELKAYHRITLEADETAEVKFTITEEQLRYYHFDMSFRSDAGKFELFVGTNSSETLSQAFTLAK